MTAAPPNYLDPAVLSGIARLELRARQAAEGYLAGLHRSPYRGSSVEFAEYREYVPGDDLRHIDWKVWGRADRYFLKQYEAETNLTCQILLDCSNSMAYGCGPDMPGLGKFDYACTLAAALAFVLLRQRDAVGAILFDGEVRRQVPAAGHPHHLHDLVAVLEAAAPDRGGDVAEVFTRLPALLPRRGVVALISDLFLDLAALRSMLLQLRHARQDVIVFHLLHRDELTFPFTDNTLFVGLEDARRVTADPGALRRSYLERLADFRREVRRLCVGSGCEFVSLSTHDPLDAALNAYLASRQARGRSVGRV